MPTRTRGEIFDTIEDLTNQPINDQIIAARRQFQRKIFGYFKQEVIRKVRDAGMQANRQTLTLDWRVICAREDVPYFMITSPLFDYLVKQFDMEMCVLSLRKIGKDYANDLYEITLPGADEFRALEMVTSP